LELAQVKQWFPPHLTAISIGGECDVAYDKMMGMSEGADGRTIYLAGKTAKSENRLRAFWYFGPDDGVKTVPWMGREWISDIG